ncbi:exopolysaccharide biosynthesis protein [Marinobacter sp. HN1S83]|uniref:exopolysaccharide biosynthesis protein n=1 Tax=Marinobacter sp. HN1S83 TaxID=3382301 RepID=UPI00387B36F4
MKDGNDPTTMKQLLDRIRASGEGVEQVSVAEILEAVGERSFGPVVLLAGLITLAPLIGDIPGVPTLLGLVVVLTLGQLLFQRHSIWLPSWISGRQVPRGKLVKGVDWLQKPARFLDRVTKPRLTCLVNGPGFYVMAVICIAVALAMPAMELVPFSANGGGAALTAFGLAIVARDGLVALIATTITGLTLWFIASNLIL